MKKVLVVLLCLGLAGCATPKTAAELFADAEREERLNNDYRKAISYYKAGLKKDLTKQAEGIALAKIGVGYSALGEFKMAEKYYKKALEVIPTASYIHFNLGTALYKQDKMDEARESFLKTIELSKITDEWMIHNFIWLGIVCNEQGEYQKAIEAFQNAVRAEGLQKKPPYFAIYCGYWIGQICYKQNDLKNAKSVFSKMTNFKDYKADIEECISIYGMPEGEMSFEEIEAIMQDDDR